MSEYYKNAAAATKANIKTTPGRVQAIRFTNVNAGVRYFQIHDKATAPAGSDNAVRSWMVAAGTATVPAVLLLSTDNLGPDIRCLLGIGFAISTTDTSFTDSATAADHTVEVIYS